MFKKLSIPCVFIILTSCSDTRPFLKEGGGATFGQHADRPNTTDVLTFYALGDWGTGNQNQKAVAKALRKNISELPPGRKVPPFVLGLGDNVYEEGLPEGFDNPGALEKLRRSFGEIYSEVEYGDEAVMFHIIPGNHDHAGKAGGKHGVGDVIHQETTAERLYDTWHYYPIDPEKNSDSEDARNYRDLKSENILSLATPEKIAAVSSKTLAVFALDTQVLLTLYEEKDAERLALHWRKLREQVEISPAVWTLIIGHHPVRSHGKHGGFRNWVWYVPPVILVTLVDKFFHKRVQDLDHPANRAFQKDLIDFMAQHEVDFYLAGHEHNLQFLTMEANRFQIVSGSAGKLSGVTHKNDTLFSHASFGFVRFDLTGRELWVEFFEVAPDQETYRSSGLFKLLKTGERR